MRLSRLLMGLVAGGFISSAAMAQFPGGEGGGGGGRGGRGGGGMGGQGGGFGQGGGMGGQGGGMMGGRPDPEMIWNMMGGQGKDAINLNDPANQRTKDRMMQRGQAIPANGMLTKAEFKSNMEKAMAGGGMGGQPGMNTMTMTPGANGQMMMSVNGGPPTPATMQPGGMGGAMAPDQIKQIMSRMDTDGDGRISMAEAQNSRGGLKDQFTQYDANRDGFIDSNEFTSYMANRMNGGGGMGGGMNGGMGGQSPWANQGQPGGWAGGPGGMNGGPPGGWGGAGAPEKGRKKDDETEKVVVYRYGNLPKELPSWFTDMDTDKDGQIGLYEWKSSGRRIDDFVELDLNGDGFLTAEEWLRKQSLDLAKREVEDRMANPNGAMASSTGRGGNGGGWSGGGGMRGAGGPPGGGKGGGNNPFTSGGGNTKGGGPGGRDNASKDNGGDKRDRKPKDQ